MRADIAALQHDFGVTTVYVTHDQSEAMTLGHRVAVLHDAKLQQCDAPRVLYDRPANTFVAGFIGSPGMNLLTLPVGNGSVELGGVHVPVPAGHGSIVLGVRPESVDLAPDGLPAQVEIVEEIGADAFVYCQSEAGRLVARTEARRAPERGSRVALKPRADEAHLFDAESGSRLE
jgi:multiple sugar transport system ATP-binding protein